ncbi:oxidoreductase [Arenimonas maotaiensis]|uniref:Oxidoreductase n=1 Tax=Arenimonas maotaiensis TaxID=1446479 RepID=A0A917FKJ9_9GAMM|nr:sulfite reductase flavoprotein subunit alpha [Arenimonas maotaiensis]GGF85813.1 oxidoreductase [Arenimonas maotaiensis]
MFKNAIFQLHWFFGITAGLVLAAVGVTGALLSFQQPLLKAFNPGVLSVRADGRTVLTPEELLARVQAAQPKRKPVSLSLSGDPSEPAKVGFAPEPGAKPGPGGRRRGESRYVDPYDGRLLAKPRGEGFFRTSMQIHRWLAAGEVGKQIVGASTVALVFFCLSGLYLRWPRRWLDWRAWLRLDWAQKGRSFLWHLHAVLGTWLLAAYLLMSLTGLYWSYDWYRDGLYTLTGKPAPDEGPRRGGQAAGVPNVSAGSSSAASVAEAFRAFHAAVPSYANVTLRLPEKPGQTLEFSYQDPEPAHERANNRLELAAGTLAVVTHERYADKPIGQKLMAGILPLHSGSFFGLPGLVLFMLASLLMPLFTVTGWLLYLDRRRKKRAARAAAAAVGDEAEGDDALLIAYASQTGTAERLAWQSAAALRAAGQRVRVRPLAALDATMLSNTRRLLLVASTFGEGEAPDAARAFLPNLTGGPASLAALRFGILALGDRHYAEFCGFARAIEIRLRRQGAHALFDTIEVDDGDPLALQAWQERLSVLCGTRVHGDWSGPAFASWRLVERVCLNPGSPGAPVYRIVLRTEEHADWQAGDIAEIRLPAAGQTVVREYSIASLPQDGRLELLVRLVRKHDGTLGAGSGALCQRMPIGSAIALRIRSNPGFHAPADDRPLILVGNGTGIAGLRALLKARARAGRRRNWLLFGERSAAHDFHFDAELRALQADGFLERIDLAFSRDQPERLYVQSLLAAETQRLRAWIDEGAAVYVCGSLDGMAPGVEAVLRAELGTDGLERLAAEGRYRRDVY